VTSPVPTPVAGGSAKGRWWVLTVVGLAMLLVMVDTTVVNIALPTAQRDLGMSDVGRQWTISAYTLAFGGLILLGGRIADRFGRRATLLVGIVGFAVASAIGGAAVNPEMLVVARIAQGLFAALIAPSTMSLLTITFTEPRERAQAFGIYGAVMMSGAAVGLLAGGALAEYLDWRWCLYVNLPIAAVAGVAGWFLLPSTRPDRDTRLDWSSGLLGGSGIIALVYALSEVATRGWDSGIVLGLLAAAVLLLAGFLYRQTHSRDPLLPLTVVTDRRRAAAFLAVAAAPVGMFGMFLFLTYQLQEIMHYGPLAAGLAFVPMLVANVLVSTQITGRLMPRTGPRPLLTTGLVLIAAGMATLTLLTPETPLWGLIVPAEVLLGMGTGLVMPTVGNTATNGIPVDDTGVASAFVTTSHLVGASIGTAALNTIAADVTASSADETAAATVHGFAVASGWAAVIVAATATAVAFLAPSGPNAAGVTARPAPDAAHR
jgi:EmrB/QacA subfamily drug resistance transporter